MRVIASDGSTSTTAESGQFGVERHEPTALIRRVNLYPKSQDARLSGIALDADDGILKQRQLVWSSIRDGQFGKGSSLYGVRLSSGRHRISFTVTDRDGNEDIARERIRVPNRHVPDDPKSARGPKPKH